MVLLCTISRRMMDQRVVEAKVRNLRILILGLKADAQEALSPFRTERSINDVRKGIQDALKEADGLIELLQEGQHGNSEVRVVGA